MEADDSLRRRLLDAALADPAALERALQLAERAYGWLGEDEEPEPLALPAPAAPAAKEDAPKARGARRRHRPAPATPPPAAEVEETEQEQHSGAAPEPAFSRWGEGWTDAEDELLRRTYSTAARELIQAALPGRSWAAIGVRASKLGLQRSKGMRAPEVLEILDVARTAAAWLAAQGIAEIVETQEGLFAREDGGGTMTARQVVRLADSERGRRGLPPLGDGADLVGGPHQSSLGGVA